ncbi:MAG: HDIG domain-containing protein, partial [Candidatus Sumerlaeota bacterium]|nr:HDIG domain-containing protein [Candidatus Sumerlaeota bacterium]
LGQPLEKAFVAPFDLTTVDQRARQEALDRVEKLVFFRLDTEAGKRSREALDRVLRLAQNAAEEASAEKPPPEQPALKKLTAELQKAGLKDPEGAAKALARRAAYEKFVVDVQGLLRHLYDERGVVSAEDKMRFRAASASGNLRWASTVESERPEFHHESLLAYPGEVDNYLNRTLLPSYFATDRATRDAVESLLKAVVEPTVVLDPEAKAAALAALLETAGRHYTRLYHKGDVVFAAGRPVGEEEEEILNAFRAQSRRYQAYGALGIGTLVGLLFALVIFYARKFPGEIPFTSANVALLCLPTIIAFALWRLLEQTLANPQLSNYGFPAALIGILSVTLLGPRLAWLLVTCAGMLCAAASHVSFEVPAVALFGGYASITTLYSLQTRRDVLRAGAIVAGVNAIVIAAISLISDPTSVGAPTLTAVAAGVANGLLCATVALPLLWIFEESFGVVTNFTLLELTGINQPLLRELEQKAPGTFQHTLNVTKLAESAAQAIGANYLLVRAGCYYHDIGKMVKPRYFSENQVTQEDRTLHAKLRPHMSVLIIKNHVKEGLDIARRHRLPPLVAAFIPEHQGTTLIGYFHNQALRQFEESESTDPVREEDFRYPGPKPQSIETAIAMLADSVEATVTSVFTSANVNEDELRQVVRRAIAQKFDDGQFDECDLTLRDLHIIRETFVKTLLGRFHHRVAYPVDARERGGYAGQPPAVRRVPAPSAHAATSGE